VKKNNYSLDKNFLSIKTECGEYRFRVDGDTGLANAQRIAEVMVSEMEKVENNFKTAREKSNPYAKILLSNLNISDKYIQLEDKYNLLLQKHEEMKALYQRQEKSGDAYKQRLKQNRSLLKTKPSDVLPPSREKYQVKETGRTLPGEIRKETSISPPQPTIKPQPETRVTPTVAQPIEPLEKPKPAQKPIEEPPTKTEAPIKPLEQEQPKPAVTSQPETPVTPTVAQPIEPLEKPEPAQKPLEEPPTKTEAPIKPLDQTKTEIPHPSLEQKQEQTKPAVPSQPTPLVKQILETLKKSHQSTKYQEQTPTKTAPPIKPQDQKQEQAKTEVPTPSLEQEQPKPAVPSQPETPVKPPVEQPIKTLKKPEPATEPPEETLEEPQEEPQEEPSSQLRINTPGRILNNAIESGHNYSDEFQLPSLDFLNRADKEIEVDHEAIRRDAELLEQKLGYFGIKGEVMAVSPGPVITTFEYKPAPGIKISKIVNLADDLALALSALSIRIVAPIPGKDVIGVEIPNAKMSIVPFLDIVGSDEFKNNESRTPVCLGKDIIGNPVVVGLDKMPHLLIAGATGTGKSVGLNAMIASILYKSSPDRVKFIMIDPKRIELSLFNDIPHLITPVITDMKKANTALQWVVREMERRYEMLAKLQVRNIEQYNQKITSSDLSEYDDECFEEFPYIVIIIDELADLMMTASKDIEFSLTRIAQMARAAGIHLILATQRPSVDVLTGIIKANFPTRISFQVSSKTDSRTIIDSNGAETLLGRGDMLFVPPGTSRLTRVHGTYLSEEELITITTFIKSQGKPRYVLDVTTEKEDEPSVEISDDDYDEKYQAALEYVMSTRQASISSVQRALRVGYNRAARIIDLMEKKGIIGPSDGVKPRQVLVNRME
jgi:S-DNA-T family DNA segregation ATPase FtsK/SpoIIIE